MNDLRQHILAVLQRSGLQPADREDVTQETMLRLSQAQSRGTVIRDTRAFATRTALRLVVDRWRDRARRNGQLPDDLAHPGENEPPSAASGQVQALYAALGKLPPRQAAVVTLRKLWELEYAEIAAALGISVENCRSHCRHGLERLRRLLRPAGEQRRR